MNPFLLDGPTQLNCSGGRTSMFMLRQHLDAHGGCLPADCFALFANTGKERPETLDFVRECGKAWDVDIRWVERRQRYTPDKAATLAQMAQDVVAVESPDDDALVIADPNDRFVEVTYETASRNGEPFADLIRERRYLPNPTQGFCTTKLKIHPMRDWMRSRGFFSMDEKKKTKVVDESTVVIGLRADEPHRVAKLKKRNHDDNRDLSFPLYVAGITKAMILAWWKEQPFDLRLKDWEGNCDLCFKKGQKKRRRIMRDRPDLAQWWIDQEAAVAGVTQKPSGAVFRIDAPPYARLLEQVVTSPLLPIITDEACDIDDLDDCACTD